MLNESNNTNQDLTTNATASESTDAPQRTLSLVLNYQTNDDKQESGHLRIVSDDLLEHLLKGTENEDAKKLLAELGSIPVEVIAEPAVIADLYEAFSEVLNLLQEIEGKRASLTDVNAVLKAKLDALKALNKIVINQEVFDSNEDSIGRYLKLVDELIQEVRAEVELIAMMIQCKKIYMTEAAMSAYAQDKLSIIKNKIKNSRRYVKSVRRDINVSYSRYSHGLSAQMKQIAYFEIANNNS